MTRLTGMVSNVRARLCRGAGLGYFKAHGLRSSAYPLEEIYSLS